MLTHLGIRDFAIVDALDIELGAGLTVLTGETGAGKSIIVDALALVRELLRPTLIGHDTYDVARRVTFPGLKGVLPGVGPFDPLDWGLGLELHDAKQPHWMGTRNSPTTFGHFGGAGTFIWVDPALESEAAG